MWQFRKRFTFGRNTWRNINWICSVFEPLTHTSDCHLWQYKHVRPPWPTCRVTVCENNVVFRLTHDVMSNTEVEVSYRYNSVLWISSNLETHLKETTFCWAKVFTLRSLYTPLGWQPSVLASLSVWLSQLDKALAAPTHVRSCVQEIPVRSPEQISFTLASIPPRYVQWGTIGM